MHDPPQGPASAVARVGRDLCSSALDLLFPPACIGCQRPLPAVAREAVWLCPSCAESLVRAAADPRMGLVSLASATSAWAYGGAVCTALLRLKFARATHLARPLGALLRPVAHGVTKRAPVDLAVPVPLHPRRLRRRGFNQAALLARAAVGGMVPLDCGALHRVRDTPPQSGLPRRLRMCNVSGAFDAHRRVSGQRVLLVDDVLTTGATAAACAHALAAAGARAIHLLTLARAMPYDDSHAEGDRR